MCQLKVVTRKELHLLTKKMFVSDIILNAYIEIDYISLETVLNQHIMLRTAFHGRHGIFCYGG